MKRYLVMKLVFKVHGQLLGLVGRNTVRYEWVKWWSLYLGEGAHLVR